MVSAALEQRFDVSGENGLADQMERVAAQLVDEYWHDNRCDIVGIVDGSFLEDYDEFNIGAAFRNAAVVSTTYALLSRCGMQPGDYFEHEDFLNVFDFNTPQTVAALGTAISQSSELVLRQIEVTIKNYEREKIAERSESHERTDLHPQRGLSDSRPEPDRAAASPAGQVRQDAEGLLEGASPGAVEQPAAVREAVPPSAGDRRGSEQPTGTDDAGADEVSGRDGSAESQRPDEVGRADEHAESAGRGNDPHGTGVQLNMFDAPAGAQMSFFPSEAEQIQSIAEAESVTPSAFSMFISQDNIDHILRAGGNADAARMKIAAEFSKQKPLEDRAAFLKALYHGGNGLITDNGRFSAWYGDDGIHIATGDTSRYLRSAQVIGWADAAERIEELLDGGAFATNLEVTEAPRYERLGIAVDVWNLYHDFSDEAKSLGYLSCLGNIHSTSFPEETERLTDDLLNPAFRDRLLSEYKVFMDAYRENRALLRFHYHRPQTLLTRLEDLSLPRKEFRSDMEAVPATGRFITEDEIAASLANGSSFEGGKTRIYAFFQTSHTPKENADFLKKEYGIGGHTHAVSRESGSYEDHGSKGITLKKAGCADVQMNWNKVASRISELIRMNRYFTPDEQALYDKAQAQDVVRNTAYDSYNAIKEAHPDDIVLFQVGDFFEIYGEDAKQAAELLDLNLTTREIPGAGRVEMCGVPSHNLEMYVEKLRDKYDVTIAEAPDFRGERHIYTLRSIDHEAEAAINAYEAEFGADGTRVFRDPAADAPQPTVRELFDGYKLTVGNALSKDTAFVNACRNSDRQNAYLEGADAIRRIVTASDDLQLVRLYFDMPAFHNRLHQELLEELYPTLAATVAPSPYQITQEDIDNALLDWHNNLKGKQEVALYMQAHGRERSTAAWLAAKYGWEDSKTPMYIHVGNAEPVTLTWAQVQRRLAQLIRENKFYDENERLRLFSPDRYSIRLHPGEGGITGIWDEVLERFCGDGEQTLRSAEMGNKRSALQNRITPFYGADAERAASALNRRLLQRDIPGMGETAVTGYDFGQWASAAKRLLEHGHSFVFAQPNETDGYDVINEADAKEYIPIGMELEIDGRKFVIDSVNFGADEVSLRDVTFQNRQGFPIFRAEHIAFVRSFVEEQEQEQPQPITKPVAFYPAEKTHLPYDIEIQTLHIPEPEHDPPSVEPAEPEPPAMSEEEALILEQEGRAALSEMGEFVPDFDDAISQAEIDEPPAHRPAVSIPIDGEWQDFPSVAAAEQAAYADFKAASRRNAQNFHITDDALGVGGAKAKFRANMAAIHLLQGLEFEGLQASPEQQEILSRYVGWGGLADAFDENKPNWSDEFAELYATLSPEEYAAARASTLNAHYTSPTVIKAIYEAVGNMGFQTGNILEPSMGVGNFFGLLPEQMQGSKLYGVELDSITGRIAKQLYPKADITIAGFETTDRKDFYDLAVGNVPFGQYQVDDRAYNKLGFSDDSSYYLLCSLEVLDDDGKLERKADMFHKRTIKQQRSVDSVDTASEALAVCIGEKACVDLSFMATLMGGSEKIPQIVEDLKGVIYKEPNSGPFDLEDGGEHWAKGWQTADEYLSGNVRQKLRTAQRVAARDPFFAGNVDALIAAQPKDLEASEIEVRLGATWFDKKYIEQFMYETFETPRYLRGQIEISYVPYTAEWQVSRKSMVRYNDVAAFTTYGTDRASAYRLLEDALNLRDIRIYDTIEDADGRERRVLNAKETTLAAQKQQLIRDAFKDWIWKDPERRETLVRQYNEEMNSTRPREYDGSHIVFSGMNPEITLREHQKNAIAHVLYGGNTLLAHEVGAGKTFEMVASAMESKRLGLCQKSIFVVPNHLTEQWASEFLRLYPSANILVTTKKDFETHNRKKFCARIATGDYDAVIIGHSQFERIPISPERQERLLHQQIEEITDGIQDTKLAGGNSFTIKSLERTKKGLEARLKKLQASDRKDDVIYFEQLGVDRMFVDESDNYKNLFLYTKMRNVAGLSTTDAQKSSDMFSKCRYMDELTGGRGVVFATGTPVSNSMTELYTIQRYLQHDRLQEMGMGHFDCWASRFGETTTALELAPEGTGYRARTRFAKFFNLPELMNLFKEVADIKTADQLHLPTPEVAYHTIATKPTQIQQDMVKALSERASKVHSGAVSPDVDNMLKITSDGRMLGLDQRIINPMLPDEETTKVNQCVANILQYWRDGEEDKLTQLVFCDISTPKTTPSQRAAKASPGTLDSPEIHALESAISLEESAETPFTVYEDVRQKLIDAGMPPEQIAFIHDANTEVKKRELFAKVRSGQVRVLMGSTAKMGAGTNVQDRLVALHDLDCPWRPRDLTQRKGRIERQGNQNKLVHVCRYVTEGTFDAYLWQTVENKQKFISQIMTSKSPVRSCEDVDATALSFAEIKALCAGDPRIKERMDLDIEVSKLKIMKADHNSKQFRLEDSLLKYFPEKIEEHKGFVRGLEADMQTLAAHPLPAEGFVGMEIRGDRLTDKENAGAALLDTCKEVKGKDPVQIGSYRGFTMSVAFDSMWKTYTLTLKGRMTHRVELGSDARGNLARIENALDKMPERLRSVQEQLENLYNQQAAAKAEVGKPFPQEQELAAKTARLIELDMELNLDGKGQPQPEQAIAKSARPSVLDRLKASPVHGAPEKPHKKEMEAR